MLLKSSTMSKYSNTLVWKQFVLSGNAPEHSVQPEILGSWKRCREAGVNHLDGYCIKVLPQEETRGLREERKQLIEIALPIMNTLYKSVPERNFIIVLANEAGIILDTVGDSEVLARTKEINFAKGADWSEESVGTNAIGTALVENKPIQVTGAEHYCRKHHHWACSAAPILNSRGKVIGCLNITNPYECQDSQFLGMVLAAARAIENQFHKEETKEELFAAHKQLTTVMSTISEGILSVDKDLMVTHANSAIATTFELLSSEMIGQPLQELLGDMTLIIDIFETGRGFLEEEIVIVTPKKQIDCTMKATPIKNESLQVVGVVITFREIKQVHRIVNKMVGAQARYQFQDIIGKSDKMTQVIKKAKIAGKSSSTVLLLGESGTGKEVFAQAIHNYSNKRNGPFIAVNCAAMPRDLIQSELFGYTEGAFTGAKRGGRPGKFELADGGTLLLDEIGDMSLELQVNLLRVLQEKNVVRIGGDHPIPINVRVIAATNKNLRDAVENGTFREDLYYRLNVMTLHIPPLRERDGDVEIYVHYFLKKMSLTFGKEITAVDPQIIDIFNQYHWPGNIRELENILEYAINMEDGDTLSKESLPSFLSKQVIKKLDDDVISLADLESQAIEKALQKFAGNHSKTAKALGIARNTLYEKIKKYHIQYNGT